MIPSKLLLIYEALEKLHLQSAVQGRTDHSGNRALPEGPGSVGGPMRCPW
ncbi:unnamed protein product [Staurois parvus]|uniref:Uncharacterized protein n=1 Tax=Staurois parvus TaxID=386267 RepID=A0ABN9GSN4_9NEOB|nr:unnamed protein product [Staurois parvus]